MLLMNVLVSKPAVVVHSDRFCRWRRLDTGGSQCVRNTGHSTLAANTNEKIRFCKCPMSFFNTVVFK